MFESSVTRSRRVEQEQVAIEVSWCPEQRHVLLADRLQVVAETCHVDPRLAANRYCVRHAARLELADQQLPDLYRVIDQLCVISRTVGAEAVLLRLLAVHCRRDAPVLADRWLGRLNVELAWPIFLADHRGEHAGAVEECMSDVEVSASHALVISENFENQRETVKEERRQRIDNQPYGEAFLVSDTLNYDWWPYSHTVIGRMVDLDAAEVTDVQEFFDKYYKPTNAVLVVVGDIDQKKTMEMVEEYFGDIPGGEPIPKLSGKERTNKGERRQIVDSPKANVPAVFIGYISPPHEHEDTPALQLLNSVLVDGESSRLHKRLVKDEEAAFGVFGFYDSRLGPSLFRLIGASNAGVDIGVVEELIQEEVVKVQAEGITEEELEKVKIQWKKSFITSRQTCMQKAEAIQHYAFYHDDLAEINTDIDRYMAVTTDDVKRVANEYLKVANRSVVIAAPPSKESS